MDRRIAPILTVSAASLWMAGCSFVSVVDPLAQPTPRGTLTEQMQLSDRSRWAARRGARHASGDASRERGSQGSDGQGASYDSPASAGVSDLTAVGFASITAQSGSDAAQRRLQAARAAKLDAYRNLAEQLYGVEFASDSMTNDSRVREDQIRVRISGVIAGAEIIALEPLGNDSYQATVRLRADKVNALLRR
ncbi:MAG: hypothetical protein FJ196_05570 [Gammaproteobacteria bacterium]|nr:hypothetical protein [Gammaproteobacteria bacterium]